ncbi:hypothetical protein PLESTB_000088100 [Pleodorina starrii]|uniref:Polycomb protein VEFS-Box domain-containing protein n=1 Tax=Pleodorina starrii TaxID=330485 RepID=A0A9W6BAT4_9CHLO|nr:hypothetical protein PLESTB_000088100 [Pleodorina starrii]GLC76567.1 hypothetical protein PLESTF_001798300 [Pleodorina starrii]
MATAEGADVALHHGIHLFTHPILMYKYIDGRQPRSILRRNLSYVANPAPAAVSRGGAASSSGSSALLVQLGDVALAGANQPSQITLVAVLCEMASTGRDFKPVHAAATTLACPDEAAQPPAAAAAAAAAGAGAGAGSSRSSGETRGTRGGWEPQQPLLLPLPQRKLTRPVLLLLVSDWHPDMCALVPPGPGRTAARRLRTDLRSGGPLLGLLPDPGPVWVALQPLDGILGSSSSGGGGGGGGDSGSHGAAAAATAAGPSGAAPSPQPPLVRAHARLQRGRLARSRCSVVAPSGATLSAMLLHLDLDSGLNLNLSPAVLAGTGPEALPPAGRDGGGNGGGALKQPSEKRQEGEQQQQQQGPQLGQQQAEPAKTRLGRTRSQAAAAAEAVPGAAGAGGGRLTRSSSGSGGSGGGGGGAASLVDDVQVVRLTSVAVALELEVRQVAGANAAGSQRPSRHATTAAPAEPPAAAAAAAEEDTIVEFRYVYDASWSFGPAANPRAGSQKPVRPAEQKRRQQQLVQRQQVLLRTEQQLLQLHRQQQQQQEERRGGDGGGAAAAAAAVALTHGSADDDALATPAGLVRGAQAAATAGAGRENGFRSGEDRASWMQQQMRQGRGAERDQLASCPPAGVTEWYFSEEISAVAGAPLRCPMCSMRCRGLQGLQQHLPASHSLYRFTYPSAAAEGPEDSDAGGSGGGGGGGGERQRRQVVEVRLPAEVVDPARCDVLCPEEDILLLQSTSEAFPAVAMRAWCFSRAAGMAGPVYTNDTLDVAATATAPTSAGAAAAAAAEPLPEQTPPPPGRLAGRGRRGGAAVAAAPQPGAGAGGSGAAAAPRQARSQHQQPQQPQQQQQQQRQQPQQQQQFPAATDAAAAAGTSAGAAAGGGSGGGSGGGGGRAGVTMVRVPLAALRKSASGAPAPQPEDGATAAAATAAATAGAGAAGAAAAAAGAAGAAAAAAPAPPLPPSALAPGVHPPGRQYYHCRSAVPGTVEELFGAHDSDDETDDEEWEATFDRHLTTASRLTPLRPADRRFFKLWSAFARRRPIYADYITRSRCLEFCRQHRDLIRSDLDLYDALGVHLLLLHEMNLVDPRVMNRCLMIVDGSINPTAEEDERFLATRGSAELGGRAATTAAAAAGAGKATGGATAAGGGDDDALGSSGSGDDDDDGGGREADGDGAAAEAEYGGTAPADTRETRGIGNAGGGRTLETPGQRTTQRRRRADDDGTEQAPEGKRRRRIQSTPDGPTADGDAAPAPAGVHRHRRVAPAPGVVQQKIRQVDEREDVTAVAGAATEAGGGGEARGRREAQPPAVPSSGRVRRGSRPIETGSAGTCGGAASTAAAAAAAAVETGAVEAEGLSQSPHGSVAPAAAAAVPPPSPRQPLNAGGEARQAPPHPLPPPPQQQLEEVQQVQQQQVPFKGPRPGPGQSWSRGKKAARALAPPVPLPPPAPRPLLGSQGRAAALAGAVTATATAAISVLPPPAAAGAWGGAAAAGDGQGSGGGKGL